MLLSALGHGGPPNETRSHVALDPDTGREGALFQTRGLRFARSVGGQTQRLGMAVQIDALPPGLSVRPGLAPLGGERRLVCWHEGGTAWPQAPDEIVAQIAREGACRLMLLTPGDFSDWKPREGLKPLHGITPEVCAASFGRAQTVSGWDLAAVNADGRRGRPKHSRRLVPAGAVYFLKLDGTVAARADWVRERWMRSVCAESQARDGFGVAVFGTWPGHLAEPQRTSKETS